MVYIIVKIMGVDSEMVNKFKIVGYFYDIGKMVVLNEIFNKEGKLIKEEFYIIKFYLYYMKLIFF